MSLSLLAMSILELMLNLSGVSPFQLCFQLLLIGQDSQSLNILGACALDTQVIGCGVKTNLNSYSLNIGSIYKRYYFHQQVLHYYSARFLLNF
jgi:hypothetical protein